MTYRPEYLPERLALISDLQAAEYISSGLLEGREDVPSIALNKVAETLSGDDARLRLDRVRDLIDDAMAKFRDERPTAADAWLAPRLHETLRLTRREAADKGIWTYMALGVAPDYVVWRHLSEPKAGGSRGRVAREKFVGPHYKQTFARLWWAAELFRNGPDYEPVETACGNQQLLHTALRLELADHRPSAQAMVQLLKTGRVTAAREIDGLCVAISAAGATLIYDVIGPDISKDPARMRRWVAEAESAPPVGRHSLPQGPDEDPVPEKSVAALTACFEDLFVTAPVRGRKSAD